MLLPAARFWFPGAVFMAGFGSQWDADEDEGWDGADEEGGFGVFGSGPDEVELGRPQSVDVDPAALLDWVLIIVGPSQARGTW